MDSSEEERERGKTVHTARAYFESKKKRYTIIDAPGHKAYVPNMIGGASQADVAIMVISARKGEFEAGFIQGGQTREHTILAKILGIDRMIFLINKMDDPSVEWSQERYNEIVDKLNPFVKKVGYLSYEFIPFSGFTGANLMERVSKNVCPWHDGPSLIEALDNLPSFERYLDKPFRMPVVDSYKDRGAMVVMGKIESGKVNVGDKLVFSPSTIEAEIISIKAHDMESDDAFSGENVEIYLKNEEGVENISIGQVACIQNAPLPPAKEFLAQFLVLEKPIFTAGLTGVIHLHSIVSNITVVGILSKLDKKTGQEIEKRPKYGKQGDLLMVRILLDEPAAFTKFSEIPQLGRFTVREEKTIAVGKITAFKPLEK